MRHIFFIFSVLVAVNSQAETFDYTIKSMGSEKYDKAFHQDPQCVEFENYVVSNGLSFQNKEALHTDQILILKDKTIVYGATDGEYGGEALHSMWSASKSVTATLVGAAIKKGWLSLDDKLADFFPRKKYRFVSPQSFNEATYEKVRIRDLLSMSANFVWNESYTDDLEHSTFIPMLYGDARKDMLSYVLNQPMDIYQPGKKWNYSGGNSYLLMKILKTLGEKRGIQDAPAYLLFDKLQMKKAFFETDIHGVAIGNSYAYLTPLEMTKLGFLYLNKGFWNGEQILDEEWMKDVTTLSDGQSSPSFVYNTDVKQKGLKQGAIDFQKYKDYVVEEGIYGQRAFWLNAPAPDVRKSKEFSNSPSDMYFAAGHFGQLIIVIPSENMVIARTGTNSDYWSRIDQIVSKTLACFGKGKGRLFYE